MGGLSILRRVLASPDEGLLALRMSAWTPLLPVLKHVVPLPRLVAFMAPSAQPAARDAHRERRIAAISRRLYRTRPITRRDNCLERSLVVYRYLARAGAEPTLVVGIRREGEGVHGHVWVTVDGQPVHEPAEELETYERVTAFGPDGRVVSARGSTSPRPGPERGA